MQTVQNIDLPCHLTRHIHEIATPFFDSFVPHKSGSTANAFFCTNDALCVHPSTEPRKVAVPMPRDIVGVYAKYDPDVEFVARGWTFLSESEIRERHDLFVQDGQARCVDIAFRYAGMGHVRVLAYDPVSEHVFEQVDGGANGYDRVANRRKRIETDVASVAKTPFETWWETLHANLS